MYFIMIFSARMIPYSTCNYFESCSLTMLLHICDHSAGDEDLEYFIAEAGDILGVSAQLSYGERSAKHILFHIFKQIIDCKKQDFDETQYQQQGHASGQGQQGDYYGGVNTSTNAQYGGYESSPEKAPALDYDHGAGGAGHNSSHMAHVDLAPMKLDSMKMKQNLLVRLHFYISCWPPFIMWL